MKDQIEQLIAACGFADRRMHLFDVRVDAVDDSTATLSGRVLDSSYLNTLHAAVAQKFPALRVDEKAVRVMRSTSPLVRSVATNLTDLHRESSFNSEMLTQVYNGTPLEILEDGDKWCFVRQSDGYLGWVYAPYLSEAASAAPTHMVQAMTARVHVQPRAGDHPVTILPAGTTLRVSRQQADWCEVEMIGEHPRGWVMETSLRPLNALPLPENVACKQMIADARKLTGVYYLWGGNTALGIDCSGLAQLVHRLAGYTLPRDADMQFDAGTPIEPPFSSGNLLFFASDVSPTRRKITHVGISTGGWNIIHSSRRHNGVYEDDVQATPHLRDSFVGARSYLPCR